VNLLVRAKGKRGALFLEGRKKKRDTKGGEALQRLFRKREQSQSVRRKRKKGRIEHMKMGGEKKEPANKGE